MWIELHDSTSDHPKIIKLARDLKIARVQALGHVVSLWVWTLRMAPDGDLSSFDMDDIEIGAQWEGDGGAFVESATKRGLIDVTPDGLVVHDWTEYATHLKAAERKRKQRIRTKESRARNKVSRDKVLQGDGVTGCHSDRPTDRPTEPTDRPTAPRAKKRTTLIPASPPVICLISTKGDYPITAEDIKGWAVSFPGVDVGQELRSMREWCISNPKKRKTPRGMRKFVTAWLTREQNRGGGRKNQPAPRHGTTKDVTERSRKRIEDDRRDPAGEAKAREIISNLTQGKGMEVPDHE